MEILDILYCPKCKQDLKKQDGSLKCSLNHCFDIAKSGYLNLLLVNDKKTKNPGDDKVMTKARFEFLNKGYFKTLVEEICNILKDKNNQNILDAGCGTGYYLSNINNNNTCNYIGLDISKDAILLASKQDKKSTYVVSSIFKMPIKDKSINTILNIFAPKPMEEFDRVLADDGIILEVVPGKNHLIELKELVYNKESNKSKEKFAFSNMRLLKTVNVEYKNTIQNNTDLINLLKMTPFWYKGAMYKEDELNMQNLEVTFHFLINIWSKNK